MSRCFPFPPPGYEKKPTIDDKDLLKKEKQKEKKHKKDKKDREKKDGKGKREDKKEKKDKHRDKKKDKEKSESRTGGSFHQNDRKDDFSGQKKSSVQVQNGEHREHLLRKDEESCKAENINNAKFVQELGRRIRDEKKGKCSLPVESRKGSQIPKTDSTTPHLDKKKTPEKENDDKRKKQKHGTDKDSEKARSKDKIRYTKRKDTETNGFFHENECRPNKTARSASSKDRRVNGVICSQPHPDTKYLKQILMVPKLDHWSGLDDQDWLFSRKDGPDFDKTNMEIEVWSEAKILESLDVCALPYVVPY